MTNDQIRGRKEASKGRLRMDAMSESKADIGCTRILPMLDDHIHTHTTRVPSHQDLNHEDRVVIDGQIDQKIMVSQTVKPNENEERGIAIIPNFIISDKRKNRQMKKRKN
jgi:hypothetical protein